MPDTPTNKVQLRGVGLVSCLMLLMMLSGILGGAFSSPLVDAFADNMLLALWISFFGVPVLLWILWRVSVRSFTRRCYTNGTFEDPIWERRMTVTFSSILLLVILIAWIFATRGIHLPFKRHVKSSVETRVH